MSNIYKPIGDRGSIEAGHPYLQTPKKPLIEVHLGAGDVEFLCTRDSFNMVSWTFYKVSADTYRITKRFIR